MESSQYLECVKNFAHLVQSEDFRSAKKLAVTLKQHSTLAEAATIDGDLFHHFGVLETYTGSRSAARGYFERVVHLSNSISPELAASSLNMLASLDIEENDLPTAHVHIQQGLSILGSVVSEAKLELLSTLVYKHLAELAIPEAVRTLADMMDAWTSNESSCSNFILKLLQTTCDVEKARTNTALAKMAATKAYEIAHSAGRTDTLAYTAILSSLSEFSMLEGKVQDSLDYLLESSRILTSKFGVMRGTTRWVLLDIGARFSLLGQGHQARSCYNKIIRAERLCHRQELTPIAKYRLDEVTFMPSVR